MAETDPVLVTLARLEVKLDSALSQGADHETRIRRLERAIWTASGVTSVLSSGATAAIVGAVMSR